MIWFGTPWPIRKGVLHCILGDADLQTQDPNPGEVTRGRENKLHGRGWITVNTNASLVGDYAHVWHPFFKNCEGSILRVGYKRDLALNALDAELKAIHLALVSAKELGWYKVLILSDAEVVVKALSNKKGLPDWRSL
ncbi:Ribonuclease H-like domain containing protein [Parasponia andersonii]|uniref:Ribonuclease H-like domain containing protein n=1 Tax=Parasponia andersonii TaxID=3476 RepID=A0A2P5DVZ1_PARAD|nr:Ribonuclease H-like domain containing protein [Parasponia andersonii]